MVDFRISIYGEKRAASVIEDIGEQAVNLRPAFEEIYLTALDIEQELFEKEGARGGWPRWTRLSFRQLQYKVRRGLSPEILRMTDKLLGAMTQFKSPEAFVRFDKNGFTWKPKDPAYKFHMTGTYKMPSRPFVRFTEQDRTAFAREIGRHLMRRRGGSIGVDFGV